MTDTLHLDKRQRAMLAEMGVRVWSPMSEAAVMGAPAVETLVVDTSASAPAEMVMQAHAEEAHLLNITVAPEFQGQGYGVLMLDALALWARGRNAQCLWLEVRVSNARAMQVYERYGYRRVGERKNYYPADHGQREHAVVMSMTL